MKIKPSQAAEEFIESVHYRVGAKNKAVLARSALCLALAETIPDSFKPADSQGKEIDDETILGEELKDVVRAALNDKAGKRLDDAGYKQSLRNHLEYGCRQLKDVWEQSGNDPTRFISALLTVCATDFRGGAGGISDAMPVVQGAVKLKVLQDEPEWTINEAGHNSLVVISGKPGTGKSQLALDLLAQVARQGVRVAFFDEKSWRLRRRVLSG
jgi:DNA sulfur modification protein DndE